MLKTTNPTSGAACRSLYTQIKNRGDYTVLPRSLAKQLGTHQAAVLMSLLNASQSNTQPDGRLWATARFLENVTGMGAELQNRVLARLEKRGLIEAGLDRRIRLNLSAIRQLVSS